MTWVRHGSFPASVFVGSHAFKFKSVLAKSPPMMINLSEELFARDHS